ncbi:MAG: hypothetical protein M3N08_05410, partial [Pseudomonadota bacterium]|nr:hypothetical protein [Pseudomonadota bacterium]
LPDAFSLCDYAIGAVVGVLILFFPSLRLDLASLRRPVRFLADRSFALYLYHLPLLHVFTAMAPATVPPHLRAAGVALLTLGSVVALASVTELKKSSYRRFFDRVLPGPRGAGP